MEHQLEIAYVGVEVADPSALATVLTEVIGLVPGAPLEDGTLTFRNDDHAHRLFVTEGPLDDCNLVGFEAIDEAAFRATLARLEAAGFALEPGTPEEAAARGVEQLYSTTLPWGARFELVIGLATADTPFTSPLVAGGFQTRDVGFGHAVFALLGFEEAERFFVDGLGMAQSDWIETEIMDGVELEVRFYHCNRRHHSIALAKVPFDLGKTLHHIQVEANERDDVGFAFDRAWDANLDFANGLGLHDNEGAFSFYVTSPAGFLLEVGHGTKTISEPWEQNRRYELLSRWGHQPIPPRPTLAG